MYYEIKRITPTGENSLAEIVARQVAYEDTKNNKNNKVFMVDKIIKLYFSKKYNKYRMELEIHNYGMRVFWITKKQLDNLYDSLEDDSCLTRKPVYVALTILESGKFHYIWSGFGEQGFDFLIKNFNATPANIDF